MFGICAGAFASPVTDKWVADPAVKVTLAVGVMTRLESDVSVALKTSVPAVVDVTLKVTTPEASLGPEAALMVEEPGPEVWARLTVLPATGLSLASSRVTVIVEVVVPSAGTEVGTATTVEVEAEGDRSMLEELIQQLKVGPRSARVTNLKIEWGSPGNRPDSPFEIR